ncbi:glucosaminidase domain-containing protein, partial [Clostridium sp.]|uniref:glucosaminidase domain-containing protein n=1 Tax=Clostridium sp. TaxID=1506 RepID=UPI0026360F95
ASAENVEEAMEKVEIISSDDNNGQSISKADNNYVAQTMSTNEKSSFQSSRDNNISYSYLNSTTNVEESMPVILNDEGRVVYSTKSMGRILKQIGGNVYPFFDINTNIYNDSSLTRPFTYINQGYVDDVPIIEDNGRSAKILVSGCKGWINKNEEMIVVPINQVTNPSYYISENGILKHFISSDLKKGYEYGHTIEIGVAPSYLKSGVRYLSYDGNYFYNGINIAQGLNNLISDLQNNTYSNSVNANNPNYTYFNYLPFRSETNYTAADLNKFINENTKFDSKLRNTGASFIEVQEKFGVNALLGLGIAINESGWGMSSISQNKNNIFGINAIDSNPGQSADSYATVKDSIYDFSKNIISRGYSDPTYWAYYGGLLGNKALGANVKYASDPFWAEKASSYAFLADYSLANRDISYLKDNDHYQLGIYTSNSEVRNFNGSLLYKVSDSFLPDVAYVGSSVIVTSTNNGLYEINPERNTSVNEGGSNNKYHGNYNFNDKGYVSTNAIRLVNTPISTGDWVYYGGRWYYYYYDGSLAKGWLKESGKWYYLYSDGSMSTGWVLSAGYWYYMNTSGQMATGWLLSGSDWYYMYSGGQMATGWTYVGDSWYYMYNGGRMATGWMLSGSAWYYIYSSGQMASGWTYVGDSWYYMYDGGRMASGWTYVEDSWYYMYSGGQMANGWVNVGGSWYYLQPSGRLA